uniref:transglycosylase SLT domain-containing protein n=1 Tax=Sedimenticola sp. TaxID=1940285 RepID=UPI003D1218B4
MPRDPVSPIANSRPLTAPSLRFILCALLLAVVSGCATLPPTNLDNACAIFRERPEWYEDAKEAAENWGLPIQIQLAIVHQESRFLEDAAPPRYRFLGLIPLWRKSSAYGYAQVKDETWEWYMDETRNWGADRDDFGDSVDFVSWYANMSQRKLGISKWDPYKQYLAYHEGHGGFRSGSYKSKS